MWVCFYFHFYFFRLRLCLCFFTFDGSALCMKNCSRSKTVHPAAHVQRSIHVILGFGVVFCFCFHFCSQYYHRVACNCTIEERSGLFTIQRNKKRNETKPKYIKFISFVCFDWTKNEIRWIIRKLKEKSLLKWKPEDNVHNWKENVPVYFGRFHSLTIFK